MFLKRISKHRVFSQKIIRTLSQLNENKANINNDVSLSKIEPKKSALDPISDSEEISHVSTHLKPTFNFAAYINKSETLQELLKLGVDLHKIELKKDAIPFVLKLKFDDIKNHIICLKELGISTQAIAKIISDNPFILKEELQNIKVRVSYLKHKKFTDEMRISIFERNPRWLTCSTQEIDERLGFFQSQFDLTGDEVRSVTLNDPKLITYDLEKIKLNKFVLKEEMGFVDHEIKSILLKKAQIFKMGQHKLLKTFEYCHKSMNVPIEKIAETPQILTCRKERLMQRHLFLKELKKDQFNPLEPNYVSLKSLIESDDATFATEVAKSTINEYNMFIKSM